MSSRLKSGKRSHEYNRNVIETFRLPISSFSFKNEVAKVKGEAFPQFSFQKRGISSADTWTRVHLLSLMMENVFEILKIQ